MIRLVCFFGLMAVAGPAALLLSCQREYSYERQPLTVPSVDTTQFVSFLSSCSACNAAPLADSAWRFETEGAKLCGLAEKAIITLERNAFTFFGPSTCSPDSGIVMTVYLNEKLDRNKTNVSAGYTAFYYYDRVKPSYVLISSANSIFNLVIDAYNHQTGIAFGRFNGFGYTENGFQKSVAKGEFRIRL